MGVRGLYQLIAKCGRLVLYEQFAYKYVAVDAFQKIYKYCNMQHSYASEKNMHLYSIINSINHLLMYNIIPVFVFDGTALHYKTKHKGVTTTAKYRISPTQIKECEKMIKLMGLKSLRAPFEADSQCAAMTMDSCETPVSTFITDDTDALAFGAKSILRMIPINIVVLIKNVCRKFLLTKYDPNVQYSFHDVLTKLNMCDQCCNLQTYLDIRYKYDIMIFKKINNSNDINFAIQYTLDDVLKYLNSLTPVWGRKQFTYSNFIELCILCGTDYQLRLVKDSNEQIFKDYVACQYDLEKYFALKNLPKAYLSKIKEIKNYYENASVIDPNTLDFTVDEPGVEIREFMTEFDLPQWFIGTCIERYTSTYKHMVDMAG